MLLWCFAATFFCVYFFQWKKFFFTFFLFFKVFLSIFFNFFSEGFFILLRVSLFWNRWNSLIVTIFTHTSVWKKEEQERGNKRRELNFVMRVWKSYRFWWIKFLLLMKNFAPFCWFLFLLFFVCKNGRFLIDFYLLVLSVWWKR